LSKKHGNCITSLRRAFEGKKVCETFNFVEKPKSRDWRETTESHVVGYISFWVAPL